MLSHTSARIVIRDAMVRAASGSSEQDEPKMGSETDPSGRFIKYDQILTRGASRTAYKGLDQKTDAVVAWNQLGITCQEEVDRGQLEAQVERLKGLDHENVLKLHACWVDEEQHVLNYITEYFNPGPLRRHRKSRKRLSMKAMRGWMWQILQGLVYLHSRSPPIVHRDLRCDTVFIHGVTGDVKIANLGLSTLMEGMVSNIHSAIGTPEFMAPELFFEDTYDAKVDIYGFGMVLLELATMEFPFRECKNTAEVMDNLQKGVFPAALYKIHDVDARDLIEQCIAQDPADRPTAKDLMEHSFFDSLGAATSSSGALTNRSFLTCYLNTGDGPLSSVDDSSEEDGDGSEAWSEDSEDGEDGEGSDHDDGSSSSEDEASYADRLNNGGHGRASVGKGLGDMSCDLMSCDVDGTEVGFELCIVRTGNLHNRIKFTFDVAKDDVEDVVDNLEKTYDLIPAEKQQFRELLYDEVGKAPGAIRDTNFEHPACTGNPAASIFTDDRGEGTPAWADDPDGEKHSTGGDIPAIRSRTDAEDHVSESCTLEDCKAAVGYAKYGNKAADTYGDTAYGKDPAFKRDWNTEKVVNMGLPKVVGVQDGATEPASKPHRGYCEPFLPKWFDNRESFVDGALSLFSNLFHSWGRKNTGRSADPTRPVVVDLPAGQQEQFGGIRGGAPAAVVK